MPNPLRRSGSGLSGSKNSSQSSSSLDSSRNEKEGEEGKKRKVHGSKNLSAAKYRAILLKSQGRDKNKNKKDKEKKKLIVRLKVSNGCLDSVGGSEKVGAERKSSGIDSSNGSQEELEDGEIRAEKTVPLEPQEDGGKLNAKVCEGGGVSEECCKDVQTRGAVLILETGSTDNVCVICKLGGGTLLGCNIKGCKKKYHRKCFYSPPKDAPLGDWRCNCCAEKNVESGVLFSPVVGESNLDAVEVADSEGVDTTTNRVCKSNNSNDSVEKLKERTSRVVASDSKFVEYWVPVKLSDVQLEQYCHILLSNLALLRSYSKNDTVEALRDVLISTRKCCDHPYFLDPSLQKMLTSGLSETEYLDVGIKASGKLHVLDKILSETKKQGVRVVIIFQSSVGSGGISLGDVLDDVVCQRCGVGSYERVDCGLIVPKKQFSRNKQAAMNRFNDKEKGRMVFLLDRRACHSSIKLSSVDIVMLYDSDLNPNNDLNVLQKFTIDSQHEQLKVLRLYSLSTLEEMVLNYATQDVTVDAQNLNHSTIHQLLRWGASNLFKQLIEFHGSSASPGPIFSSEHLVKELFGPLPRDALSPSTNTVVVKVNQIGGTFSRDIPLPGEIEMQSVDEDLPPVFWTKLLNRKTPEWRYLPAASSSQRIRKRVQYFKGSLEKMDIDNDDVTKKRRKVLTGTIDVGARKPVVEDKRKVGNASKEGKRIDETNASARASGTPACDCSQFLPSPAVPTGTRSRKANEISSVPAACMGKSDKISVQQELEGEIRESRQSCPTVLPPPCPEPIVEDRVELADNSASESSSPPSVQLGNGVQPEPPCPESPDEDQVGLVNNSALGSVSQPDMQLENAIQSEPPRPEPPVKDQIELDNSIQFGHITSQQAEYPTQQPATVEHAEIPSHDVVAPLETMLQLSLGGSGTCLSDSRSMRGVPDSINHPRHSAPIASSRFSQSLLHHVTYSNESVRICKEPDQVGLVLNSVQPNTQLDCGIQLGLNNSRQAQSPSQPATTEEHSEVPSYNDALQDTTLQLPMFIDGRVSGSVTRVSDFRSLGVAPDCISCSLHIAPPTSSQTSQSPLQVDPFTYEKARICREQEQAAKLCEELNMQARLDYFKEVQEINKKYSKLQHDNDTMFARAKNANYTNYRKVCMNELLAKCFADKMLRG